MLELCFLDVLLLAPDFCEYTKINLPLGKPSEDSELRSMPALEFPSHAAHILGGNRNRRRHGLLQGDDRGGSRKTVDESVCMSF